MRKREIIVGTLFFANILSANAQGVLKGKIIDHRTGEPVVGAIVKNKADKQGSAADVDGNFTLNLKGKAPYELEVSYIGYAPQTIEVYELSEPVEVELTENSGILNEVVITGYTEQKRSQISGSVENVKFDGSILNQSATGFDQLLQGHAAGVTFQSNNGDPGGSAVLRIRGTNSINANNNPLFIVDGVYINGDNLISTRSGGQNQSDPLSDIAPEDIDNITVLKDANATAIYGSQGANGVIIITTKHGSKGQKAKVKLNISHGWAQTPHHFRLADGPQQEELANESFYNTQIDKGVSPADITLPFPDWQDAPTYDRAGLLFRTADISNYGVSVQGGTSNSSYYASLGYNSQESIVKPTDYERYNGRLNYETDLSKRVHLGTNISLSRVKRHIVSHDNNPIGIINGGIFPRTYLPLFNEDGSYASYGSFDNVIAQIKNANNTSVTWHTIANGYLTWDILDGLKFKTSWSLDFNDLQTDDVYNSQIAAGKPNGNSESLDLKHIVETTEQTLTYHKIFGGRHDFTALLGNTVSRTTNQSTDAYGEGFATDNITSVSAAATTRGNANKRESRLVSFFGKASYTLNDKYTIDASIRADGSSRFGDNNRWGYFPSFGLTWNATNEKFIKRLHVFDALKLRASFGYAGNQNGIGDYAALGLWNAGADYLESAGTAPSQLANPDLGWETTRQFDVGVDFTVLKNHLDVTFDYYNKYTYDLLLNVPVPYRSGYSSYLQNYGAVRNSGIELTLNSRNIETKDFSWESSFNFSKNVNKIEKLASDITSGASGRNISILRKGYPINSFYVYHQLYVDPQTGNAVYEDVNKDGKITMADRVVMGHAAPDFTAGLTNNLRYKGFTLNFFFYWSHGNDIYNMENFFLVNGGTQRNIGFNKIQLNRWQKPGDVTDIPRLTTYSGDRDVNGGSANNYGGNVGNVSSRYLEDASFLRLKNLSLSYSFPRAWIKHLYLSKADITFAVTNVFTITNYSGLDPEISATSGNQNNYGYDWATVPQPRTYTVTLNLTF